MTTYRNIFIWDVRSWIIPANLGVMLIRLSETNIWGKLAASMVTEEGGAIYILTETIIY